MTIFETPVQDLLSILNGKHSHVPNLRQAFAIDVFSNIRIHITNALHDKGNRVVVDIDIAEGSFANFAEGDESDLPVAVTYALLSEHIMEMIISVTLSSAPGSSSSLYTRTSFANILQYPT